MSMWNITCSRRANYYLTTFCWNVELRPFDEERVTWQRRPRHGGQQCDRLSEDACVSGKESVAGNSGPTFIQRRVRKLCESEASVVRSFRLVVNRTRTCRDVIIHSPLQLASNSSSSSSVLFQALGPYTHKIYIKHTQKHTNHANTNTNKTH